MTTGRRNIWHVCTRQYITNRSMIPPWKAQTEILIAWDYDVKTTVPFLGHATKVHALKYIILDLLTCHHFRGAYSDYQAHIYTLSTILPNYSFSLFILSCNYLFCTHLLSVFLSSLNAPWAQRSCLFCLLSRAGLWRLRRSIILIRTGQSLLW